MAVQYLVKTKTSGARLAYDKVNLNPGVSGLVECSNLAEPERKIWYPVSEIVFIEAVDVVDAEPVDQYGRRGVVSWDDIAAAAAAAAAAASENEDRTVALPQHLAKAWGSLTTDPRDHPRFCVKQSRKTPSIPWHNGAPCLSCGAR